MQVPVTNSPPVVGVICEYDPFHEGHRRQFALIREALPEARIVCAMSGCFTQRGMPALLSPRDRALAALHAGADLVLELPCAFAVRDAEHFALGGVSLLTQLGFVTHLSFGCENDLSLLAPAAALLEQPTPEFSATLRAQLDAGASFAAAQGKALSACLPHAESAPWDRPNNILALCYLRAIARLQSPLIPLPVRREGNYHATALSANAYPSATAVRRAFLAGERQAAEAACGYPLPAAPVCRPDALDRVLLYKLRSMSAEAIARLPDCTEGLENRLKACAAEAVTREALLALLKTRRYAHARLSRLCAHALLDITAELLADHPLPEYARMLGLRQGSDVTSLLKKSRLPIVAKATDGKAISPLWQVDECAYELWALGAGVPSGMIYTQSVAVV